MNYIVAAVGEWNRLEFERRTVQLDGSWHFASTPEELESLVEKTKPSYIFFPHWRWIVPKKMLERFECVCFHMTDVPYGRGGSPLQNLIVRGDKSTVLTALRMEEGLDTGPVYYKRPLSLEGKAEAIYRRATLLSWDIIEQMVEQRPDPTPQKGEVVLFKRRTPDQSHIPCRLDLEQVYDYIRMLDAPGYPRAFLEVDGYTVEFEDAVLQNGEIIAQAKIKIKE